MCTHVINSGSPAADPSAAERSAESETLRCRPAGAGFAGPDYSMYAHDMSLLGSTLAATMAGVTPRTTTVRLGQGRDRLSPCVCSLPGTQHECWRHVSYLRQPPHQRRADVALALQLAQTPALFEVAERSVPSRIAEALAHVGRAGRVGVVLIDFSNDRRGA
jgi:hypothetical protein